MTKTEIATLQAVIRRLKCEPVRWQDGTLRPGEADEVREALRGPAALYLDTWVIPALEMLLPGENRDPELARRIAS